MTVAVENWQKIKQEIEKSCHDSGRSPHSVQLIAVSKTFDCDEIRPVLNAGQRIFAENRVQ